MKDDYAKDQLRAMFNNGQGTYCIVQRMPVKDAFESPNPRLREAVAEYLKAVVVAMSGSEGDYTCFVCDEPWSRQCAPHQFLLIETMVSEEVMASAICDECCNNPSHILAALNSCFGAKFMVMQEAGHA